MYIKYAYDNYNELNELTSSDSKVHYVYKTDAAGRVVRVDNPLNGLSTIREYDDMDNIISEKQENGIEIRYEYVKGRKSKVILPDNSSIEYMYDDAGMRRVLRNDAFGNMVYSHRYVFNDIGKVRKENLIGEIGDVNYEYDRDGLCTEIFSPFHRHSLIEKDSVGNVVYYDDNGCESDFEYDGLDQITKAGLSTFSYNSHYENVDNKVDRDLRGRPTMLCGEKLLHYDGLDRLIAITKESEVINYEYDPWNRLVLKTIHDDHGEYTEKYLYDLDNEIAKFDESNNLIELRVLGLGKDGDVSAAVSFEIGNMIYAPLHDTFGNVTTLVDITDRSIVARYSYTPFGVQTKTSSQVENYWRYQSKRIDPHTGLYYFNNRFYNPESGEFMGPDLIEQETIPNSYHFNYNNPLRFFDSYGLDPIPQHKRSDTFNYIIKPPADSFFVQCVKLIACSIYANSDHMPNFVPDLKYFYGSETKDTNRSFIFVNGINYQAKDVDFMGEWMSNILKSKVICIMNENDGMRGDLIRTAGEKFGCQSFTSLNVRHAIKDQIAEGKKEIHIFAHSEGGTISYNAISTLTERERLFLHVHTFGASSVIPRHFGKQVDNYVSCKDPIALLECKKSILGKLLGLSPHIHFLKPHPNAGIVDHSIFKGSYRDEMEKIITSLSDNYSK